MFGGGRWLSFSCRLNTTVFRLVFFHKGRGNRLPAMPWSHALHLGPVVTAFVAAPLWAHYQIQKKQLSNPAHPASQSWAPGPHFFFSASLQRTWWLQHKARRASQR